LIVVAYYTPGFGSYEAEEELLERSADRAGVALYVSAVENGGNWYANTARKAGFIADTRGMLAGPLLYVDVDAVVHDDPSPYFDALGADGVDFGAHWFASPSGRASDVCGCVIGGACDRPHRLLSGTLYFGDTPGARSLLEAWCGMNDLMRRRGLLEGGGQKNLWYLTTCMPNLKTVRLPGRYCRVFDKPWAYPAAEPVVIEHTIASREHRGPSLGKTNAARQKRIAELRADLEG
jgi:hypothetical protein